MAGLVDKPSPLTDYRSICPDRA